jgi:hypothetical protein
MPDPDGYYRDPAVIDCVREWLRTDSVCAMWPVRSSRQARRRRGPAVGRGRGIAHVERHALPVQRLWSGQLDVPVAMPRLQILDTLRAIAALEFLPRARPRSPG